MIVLIVVAAPLAVELTADEAEERLRKNVVCRFDTADSSARKFAFHNMIDGLQQCENIKISCGCG